MRLAEKPMLRSYHALDYDWTPLSRNPCWLSNAVHRLRCYVRRNRLCLISSVGYHSTNDYYQLLLMLNSDGDKSFVDDLVASRYCKCESSLCCYEALRFILCFYDLFFSVIKILKNVLFGSGLLPRRSREKIERIDKVVDTVDFWPFSCGKNGVDTVALLWKIIIFSKNGIHSVITKFIFGYRGWSWIPFFDGFPFLPEGHHLVFGYKGWSWNPCFFCLLILSIFLSRRQS